MYLQCQMCLKITTCSFQQLKDAIIALNNLYKACCNLPGGRKQLKNKTIDGRIIEIQ